MQQNEYWFARHPNGFYKFLSSCSNKLYKEGDSWTEEMGFSEDEFRYAFSKIGVKYTSKKQLLAYMEKSKDPFQGKMYLSYKDRLQGTTTYLRNHVLIDMLISELINHNICDNNNQLSAQSIDLKGHRLSRATDIGKVHLPTLEKSMSVAGETPDAYKEQETTTEITSKITAAREADAKQEQVVTPDQVSAAAVSFSPEALIQEKLTSNQERAVLQVIQLLAEELSVPEDELFPQVKHVLEDPSSFTAAGNDFQKKLNTIKKVIRKSKVWCAPAGILNQEAKEADTAKKSQDVAFQEINSEYQQWRHLYHVACEKDQSELQQQYSELMIKTDRKRQAFLKKHPSYQTNKTTQNEGVTAAVIS
jgi:hypothetical protein